VFSCQKQQQDAERKDSGAANETVTAPSMETSEKALSPLDNARGKEIVWEDGKPLFVWDSVKDLPTLDETFPSRKERPEDFKFTTHAVQEIVLPETEERKRLIKGILDENEDQLTAIISSNRQCIVEIYKGTPPPDNVEQKWLRGIDPETKEVLWKHDEPALYPSSFIQFAWNANSFILTDIYDEEKRQQIIKLFSCRDGYIRDAVRIPIDKWQAQVPPLLFPDGKKLLNLERHAEVIYDSNAIELKRWNFGEYRPLGHRLTEDSANAFIYLIEGFKDKPNRTSQFVLLDLKSHTLMWKTRLLDKLGDDLFLPTNYSIHLAEGGAVSGVWFMDPRYIDYGKGENNPKSPDSYNNIALLFNRDGIPHAFRLQSIDLTMSDDGKYLVANGKFYDIGVLRHGM
jgi:hypothetical protein